MESILINSLYLKLLILLLIVWISGKIFRAIKLPVIYGQLIAGIFAGPLFLNLIQPSETIQVFADLGIFFLMLHAGLETSPHKVIKNFKQAFPIAILGMLVPFIGGVFLAKHFEYGLATQLFIGLSASLSAIAITSRNLKNNHFQYTKIYSPLISATVLIDVLGLMSFSVITHILKSGDTSLLFISLTSLKILTFFGTVIFLGHHFDKFSEKVIKWGNQSFTITLIIALTLGLLAESIGLHIIEGAFLAGLFIKENPGSERIYNKIEDRIYGISYGFLGPIFFISVAFFLNFQDLFQNLPFLLLLVITTFIGKTIGASIIAYFQGHSKFNCLLLSCGMNCQGAIGIVIAYEALKASYINDFIFSAILAMGLISTLLSILSLKIMKYHKNKHQSIINLQN